MPMVTSSRLRPYKSDEFYFTWQGQRYEGNESVVSTGNESVWSWRSYVPPGSTDPEESQLTQSSGSHSGFLKELKDQYDRGAKSSFDTGHEFWSTKNIYTYANLHSRAVRLDFFGSPSVWVYNGIILPMALSSMTGPDVTLPTGNQMDADGTSLIKSALPTAAEASLAQFVGEMREKLPALLGLHTLKSGHFSAANVGAEHLNIEFGVKPFIADLQKLARGVLKANSLAKQYSRDSEHLVHRKRSLGETTEFVQQDPVSAGLGMTTCYPITSGNPASAFFSNPSGDVDISDIIRSRVWFSGAFTYYVHRAQGFLGTLDRWEELANHLLGTRFSVETLWELTPWSWLIDWFSNVGDFIANAEALSSDSLVLKYGYVMHETRATRTYTRSGLIPVNGTGPGSATVFVDYIHKNRRRATPYGFGIDVEQLSPQRWAILAALGLTKSPRSLGNDSGG